MSKETKENDVFESQFAYIPEYNVVNKKENLLSWSWAEKKLIESTNYWLTTVSGNLKPHLMPIWGVWYKNKFYFSTGSHSKKARNLNGKGNCTISVDDSNHPVIVEGRVKIIRETKRLEKLAEIYNKKYNWKFDVKDQELNDNSGNKGSLFEVTPEKVIGWEKFPISMTKWVLKSK